MIPVCDLSTRLLRIMAAYSDIGSYALRTPTTLMSGPQTARRFSRSRLLVGDNQDC